MNYKEAMNYIKNTEKFGRNYGLSRTEKILELLDNPHKELKCIHIAGTNGKGSISAMLNSILIQAGNKVGMYTSPYLEVFEERIQINSENIKENSLSFVVTEVKKAVDEVIKLGYEHPTEFEIITCAALLYFRNEKVDFAVIEVGLGGRLDSTNVIHPILSIITSISYDHMQVLGETIKEITIEKAGIIKNKVPVVLYPQEFEVESIIENTCFEKNSSLIKVRRDSIEFFSVNGKKYTQVIHVKTYKDEYDIELSLLGSHQLLNCSTVLTAVELLKELGIKIEKSHILFALKSVKWIGRLEVMNKTPLIVIDGAHNIDGINKLVESVEKYFKYDNLILVLGILADKQVEDMIKVIAPLASKIIAVTPHSERGSLAVELKKVILKYNENCDAIENYSQAYEKALSYSNSGDIILFSGSLHMIGDMRKIIKAKLS
ncbi:MAG: bifunctional folylpolyglutamate synthase/dihydrofolate synthase [Clostridiaceae bacterium]|nr:bifunctional folylpolyglutamate synthase/dihydrofolate synthase [Clostridiaceae bacterium]